MQRMELADAHHKTGSPSRGPFCFKANPFILFTPIDHDHEEGYASGKGWWQPGQALRIQTANNPPDGDSDGSDEQ